MTELRDAVKKSIFREKQFAAQQKSKEEVIDKLVDSHSFPIPEAYVDRQIENQVRAHCGTWRERVSNQTRLSSTGRR